ncbi:hypothetical protein E1264_09845 [Actinomadura sp. KC216]|uniref:hypothetical protein n=1 Tax=Actinomadura sp. KC216 TaxID=2530370 RepID=UPI00104821A0|nr:hypothetical protein [Actinomadura sp. KC216]TDB88882.1 hypothetical protein E1264_09845 [Actinomadura sp. KC216]
MADKTVAGDAHLIVSDLPGRRATRGCIGPKIAAWALAALVAAAAAGLVAAFLPRGEHRRGHRRVHRRRPWQRVWSGAPVAGRDDEADERRG